MKLTLQTPDEQGEHLTEKLLMGGIFIIFWSFPVEERALTLLPPVLTTVTEKLYTQKHLNLLWFTSRRE